MTTPQAPESLSPIELDLLAAYREASPMPAEAKANVRQRLRQDAPVAATAATDRTVVRIGIGLAAAAAVLAALWALSPRGTDTGAGDDDAAHGQAVFSGEQTSAGGQAQARTPEPATPKRPAKAGVVPTSDDEADDADAEAEARPDPAPLEPHEPTALDDAATNVPADAAPSDATAPRPRAKRPRAPEPTPPADDAPAEPTPSPLAQEREILARAWAALARGDADDAIAIAKTHADRFPSAILAVERRAIERIAACKTKRAGWQDKAQAFLDAHGKTPLARKVRDACGEAVSNR